MSSPSGRRGTSVDVPGRHRQPSSLVGDVVLPHCRCCWRAVVVREASTCCCYCQRGELERTYDCVHTVVSKKCTTTNIVHRRLVATSLRATWNLHSVSDRSVVGGGDLTHLGSSCPVSVRRYSPSFMTRGGTVVMVICPSLFATSPLATWPLVVV